VYDDEGFMGLRKGEMHRQQGVFILRVGQSQGGVAHEDRSVRQR
jgi:hypothetical protein